MKIKCSDCGGTPDAESSLKNGWYYVDGDKIRLTYFKCDKCGTYHIVQLDDEQTLICLEEVSRRLRKSGEYSAKGKTPRKRLINGLRKKNKELSKLRRSLVERYSGKGNIIFIDGERVLLDVEMQQYV